MENPRQGGTDEAALSGPLRTLVLGLWQRTRIDWGFASTRLNDAFRQNRELSAHSRRAVAETLYGMIRHARRIDAALFAGGLRVGPRAPDRERIVAYEVLEQGLAPAAARGMFPDIDWERVRAIDKLIAKGLAPGQSGRDPATRLALAHSLPDWLARLMVADHGGDAEKLAAALAERAPMTIRTNTLAGDRGALMNALAEAGIDSHAGALCPTAVVVDSRVNLFSLAPFRTGHFEAQDEGSQLIAELCAPPPKALVVDYCAGAGGKTLALAALMNSRGRLLSTDVSKKKLAELRRRARRAGVTNVQVQPLPDDPEVATPKAIAAAGGCAHRVLVDAPCSGIGALRRNPEAKWRLTEGDAARFPALQLAILEQALPLVAPGGRLIYATCTVLRRENRGVIDTFLNRHPELSLFPVKAIWGAERAAAVADESGVFLELLPHRHGTDGFFAAVIRRPPA